MISVAVDSHCSRRCKYSFPTNSLITSKGTKISRIHSTTHLPGDFSTVTVTHLTTSFECGLIRKKTIQIPRMGEDPRTICELQETEIGIQTPEYICVCRQLVHTRTPKTLGLTCGTELENGGSSWTSTQNHLHTMYKEERKNIVPCPYHPAKETRCCGAGVPRTLCRNGHSRVRILRQTLPDGLRCNTKSSSPSRNRARANR